MYKITSVLERLPRLGESRMVSGGLGVWLSYSGQLSTAVTQTLSQYGGLFLAEDLNQALWFFFTDEAFSALARIEAWAKLNPMPLFIEVLPVSMLVSFKLERSASVSTDFFMQEAPSVDDLQIWVHPNFKNMVTGIPGLKLLPDHPPMGLARAAWQRFEADQSLKYENEPAWHFIIRPLGDPLDKDCAEGWRNVFGELKAFLEAQEIKFLVHEGFILFTVDGIKRFRLRCREILELIGRLKESGEKYWPCVMAAVPKKTFSFSKDLPKKVALDWKKLTPDFPHMSYRSAFLLGQEFKINEVRYSSLRGSVEDWCNISLGVIGEEAEAGTLGLDLPVNLLRGENEPCFYCGLINHKPKDCPSKVLRGLGHEIWKDFSRLDIDRLAALLGEIDLALVNEAPQAFRGILQEEGERGTVARALMQNGLPMQLRLTKKVFCSTGRDMPEGLAEQLPHEGPLAGGAYELLLSGERDEAERVLAEAVSRQLRNYQLRSLQGFCSMEQGDWNQALYYWEEAQRLSLSTLQKSYHLFLQARVWEVQGDYQKSVVLYKQVHLYSPKWRDPLYRQGVCMVKMGFTDQGLAVFEELIRSDGNYFNRILVDPELERGRVHLMSQLWKPWNVELGEADLKAKELGPLGDEINAWFEPESEFHQEAMQRLKRLEELAKIKNFILFAKLVAEIDELSKDVKTQSDRVLKAQLAENDKLYEALRGVHQEAQWFPFPKLLKEFNTDFNYCAARLNWMRTSKLEVAENYRKSLEYAEEIEDRLKTLNARLVTLRIVRDSTLFVLMLGRSFVWMEVIGLGLALVLVPCFVYLMRYIGNLWLAELIGQQHWQFQKVLVIILSVLAMAMAVLKTALSFERRKKAIYSGETDERGRKLKDKSQEDAKAKKAKDSKKAKKK